MIAPHSLNHAPPKLYDERLPSVTAAEFRQAFSQLAAGVCIITTTDSMGQPRGLTATAVTSLSLDPPLAIVCIDNRASTAAALQAGSGFIVHVLSADQEGLARQFARSGPDKFSGVAYQITATGYPRLEHCLASIECAAHCCYPGGDHSIVVGRVIDTRIMNDSAAPLLYVRGGFARL
jgi:flavin reductase (DIM6/NTAB) family NADH-FMN oxidoreductase RutF